MPQSLTQVLTLLRSRYTVATLSTPQSSGLLPFPASCTLPRWVRIPPFHTPTSMLRTNPINVGMGIVTLCFQYSAEDAFSVLGFSKFGVVHLSISVSLNVLLTLMIVIRLILHARNVRTATGTLAGISRLYKTISTMFIESCALFTVTSTLVIGALAAYIYNWNTNIWITGRIIVETFFPVLAEIQVCSFPRRPSLGQLSNATAGDRSTIHHSAGRQRKRGDGPRHHHWTHHSIQCWGARGTDG